MPASDGTLLLTPDQRLEQLENRVRELEQRITEAGRRALFHSDLAERHAGGGRPETFLADVGRALLFDSETPDGDDAAQTDTRPEVT